MDYGIKINYLGRFRKGFTLVEILLAIALLAFLTTIVAPVTLDFYRRQQLQTYTQEIVQALRRAQTSAMSIEGDSSFGVYFSEDSYILFRGDSYTLRNVQYDEVFDMPKSISVSGLTEAVFLKPEGNCLQEGQVIVANNIQQNVITINKIGRINFEL